MQREGVDAINVEEQHITNDSMEIEKAKETSDTDLSLQQGG